MNDGNGDIVHTPEVIRNQLRLSDAVSDELIQEMLAGYDRENPTDDGILTIITTMFLTLDQALTSMSEFEALRDGNTKLKQRVKDLEDEKRSLVQERSGLALLRDPKPRQSMQGADHPPGPPRWNRHRDRSMVRSNEGGARPEVESHSEVEAATETAAQVEGRPAFGGSRVRT